MRVLISLLILLIASPVFGAMYSTMIEVPSDLLIDETWVTNNQGAAYELQRTVAEWPPVVMPDTQVVGARKLILAKVEVDGDDPVLLLNTLFTAYALDWSVTAMKAWNCAPASCSDEFSNQEDCELAGEVWTPEHTNMLKPVPVSALDFQNSRYVRDENGDIISEQVKDFSWFAAWQAGDKCMQWVGE